MAKRGRPPKHLQDYSRLHNGVLTPKARPLNLGLGPDIAGMSDIQKMWDESIASGGGNYGKDIHANEIRVCDTPMTDNNWVRRKKFRMKVQALIVDGDTLPELRANAVSAFQQLTNHIINSLRVSRPDLLEPFEDDV